MQLSENLKPFSWFFIAFFEYEKMKMKIFLENEPHSSSISEVIDSQRPVYLNA